MPYDEMMSTPVTAIHERLAALERLRYRDIADIAEALVMSGDISWGRTPKGKLPKKGDWWFEETPFAQWLQERRLLGQGYSPEEIRRFLQSRRIAQENKKNLTALLN